MYKVLNIYKDKLVSTNSIIWTATDIYIGRVKNSKNHFGNPFTHLNNTLASVKLNSRDEAVDAFEGWLNGFSYQEIEPDRRLWILENLYRLKYKNLVCFCAPARCHGDILIKLAALLPDK